MQYIAQLLLAPPEIIKKFRETLQMLTCSPRFAFGHHMLVGMRELGYNFEFKDFELMNIAALRRTVLRSEEFELAYRQILAACRHPNASAMAAAIGPKALPWFNDSPIAHLKVALDRSHTIVPHINVKVNDKNFQAAVFKELKILYHDNLGKRTVMRRLNAWNIDTTLDDVDTLCGQVKEVIKHTKAPGMAVAVIKTACRAWCTGHRFQQRGTECRFCDIGIDKLEHILRCNEFCRALSTIQRIIRVAPSIMDMNGKIHVKRLLLIERQVPNRAIVSAALCDAILSTHSKFRDLNAHVMNEREIAVAIIARLKMQKTLHPIIHDAFREQQLPAMILG